MGYKTKDNHIIKSTQNSQTVKKGAAHAKKQHEKSCEIKGAAHAKKQHEKSCEIKGGGPEVAVVVW